MLHKSATYCVLFISAVYFGCSRTATGRWLGKDVRAFDASDLEQWLEQSIPAQTRMREFQGGAGQQVTTLGQIWLEWAAITEPELPEELFAPAAEQHQKQLETWLEEPPASPFVVTADSTLEALAFLSCALKQLAETCPGAYERAVVIRSLEAFTTIARISSNFIAIVASSEVEKALAVEAGERVQSSQVFLCVAVGKKAVQAPRATTPRRQADSSPSPARRSSA